MVPKTPGNLLVPFSEKYKNARINSSGLSFCQAVFIIALFKSFETRVNIVPRFYPDQDKRIRFHRLSHADSQVQFIEANRSAD